MGRFLVVALFASMSIHAAEVSAALHTRELAAIEPHRVASDATPVDGRAAAESRANDAAMRQHMTQLEAKVGQLEEALAREARLRDNWIQGRFEESDRRIIEVIGRLQLFVGWLIVLLLVIFVWLVELTRARSEANAKKVKPAKEPSVALGGARRSGRFG